MNLKKEKRSEVKQKILPTQQCTPTGVWGAESIHQRSACPYQGLVHPIWYCKCCIVLSLHRLQEILHMLLLPLPLLLLLLPRSSSADIEEVWLTEKLKLLLPLQVHLGKEPSFDNMWCWLWRKWLEQYRNGFQCTQRLAACKQVNLLLMQSQALHRNEDEADQR